MEESLKQSYIREFNLYRDELMQDLEELKSKTKHNFTLQTYGDLRSYPREFHYNIETGKGWIFVNGNRIEVI